MKTRIYYVLSRAVEEGISYGWQRAHKHTDKPDEAHILDQIEQAIMNAICETFSFDDESSDA